MNGGGILLEYKNIDVVLVTFNRLKLLKECIDSLLNQQEYISNIYVINNNSTDGTTEYLASVDEEKVNVVNLHKNIGGAAGFEYGVNKATSEGQGDYVWIMDDDTIPCEKAAENLLHAGNILNNNFGFLCSNVRWTDGSPTNIAHVSKKWPQKINSGLVRVDAATFVSILIPKENIRKLGLPIGDMEIWGDDTEYTTRMSSYKESYFVVDSLVVHKTSYNLAGDSLKNISADRIKRFKCMYRNLIYVNKQFGTKKDIFKMTIGNLLAGIKALTAKNKKIIRFYASVSGTLSGYFFKPHINFPSRSATTSEED